MGLFGSDSTSQSVTQNLDYSKAFGSTPDYSSGNLGNKYSVQDSSGLTFNSFDAGAVQAGRDIALSGISSAFKSAESLTQAGKAAIEGGLGLSEKAAAGQSGQLVTAITWIGIAGLAAWLLATIFGKPKKAAT